MKFDRYLLGIIIGGLGAAASACNSGHECGEGTTEVDGVCVAAGAGECGPGTVEQDGECVPDGSVICETGTTYDAATGTCVADITGCAEGTVLVEGECVPEDEARDADVEEPAEPNDAVLESDGFGEFDTPAEGDAITVHGCINPYRDIDGDGELDPDTDVFLFNVSSPTVIDVTVDGINGVAGGFAILPVDQQLSDEGWLRVGANLVGDTSQQQVLLPKTGPYLMMVADSRWLVDALSGEFTEATGGPDACYFMTVSNIGIPEATAITGPVDGVLGGDIQVYSYDPASDGAAIENAAAFTSQSAAVAVSTMIGGTYRGGASLGFNGSPVTQTVLGLEEADDVLVFVEPVVNYSITDVTTTVSVRDLGAVAAPDDGSTVTITQSDVDPFQLLVFFGNEGDVVRLQFSTTASWGDVSLYPQSSPSVNWEEGAPLIADVCYGCDESDTWVRLPETGYYYLAIRDEDAFSGDAHDVTLARTAVTPTALTLGTPAAGTLADVDRGFYEVPLAAGDAWFDFSVAPTNFTDARVRIYSGEDRGQIDSVLVPVMQEGVAPLGRIVYGTAAGSLLISIEDDAGHDGDETFDLTVAEKDFVDAGTLTSATPVTLTGITADAGEDVYVFARGPAGDVARATLSPIEGDRDLVIEVLDRTEATTATIDSAGAGGDELLVGAIEEGFVALRVYELTGQSFSFDGEGELIEPTTQTSAPALPFSNANPVSDTVNFSGTCTIVGISVDMNITHTYRGDVVLDLESPSGTVVTLKAASLFDSADDVIGNFPETLAPFESLDAFLGEDGGGTWTLDVSDTFAGDDGTLNSWGVNLYCL